MSYTSTSINTIKSRRAYLALILAVVLAICLPGQAFATGGSAPSETEVNGVIDQVSTSVISQYGKGGPTYNDEWTVLALARAGKLSATLKNQYLSNLAQYLKDNKSTLGNGAAPTDYERVILALTSIGVDATNFNGIDLTAPLADLDTVTSQGANSIVYALLALDSHDYPEPALAAGAAGTQTTRKALISALLSTQTSDTSGGYWSYPEWGEVGADPDLTAMVLQALAPYYHAGDTAVDDAVDAALAALSAAQDDVTAGFITDWGYGPGAPGSTSSAQVLTALAALNIPIDTTDFTKAGGTVYDSLTSFLVGGGAKGFAFNAGSDPDPMSTEQGFYALVAYSRALAGKSALYDMNDVEIAPYKTPENNNTGSGGSGQEKGADKGKSSGRNGSAQTTPLSTPTNLAKTLPSTGDTTATSPLMIALAIAVVALAGAGAMALPALRRREDRSKSQTEA